MTCMNTFVPGVAPLRLPFQLPSTLDLRHPARTRDDLQQALARQYGSGVLMRSDSDSVRVGCLSSRRTSAGALLEIARPDSRLHTCEYCIDLRQ